MTPKGDALPGPFGSIVTASSPDAMPCGPSDATNM
jgi:hypothetical protein